MPEAAERYCYYHRGHFIPECWGGAIYGPERCTCPKGLEALPSMAKRIRELEQRVAALEAVVKDHLTTDRPE